MIKLKDLITEIKYTKPNFEYEWNEAKRYPELRKVGKEGWIELANKGYVTTYSKIKSVLGNVDLNFDGLEKPKKQRFQSAFENGVIETPIVLRNSYWPQEGEKEYDLLGGNTRIAGLVNKGVDPNIWVVEL
jgi:hypothetical protein